MPVKSKWEKEVLNSLRYYYHNPHRVVLFNSPLSSTVHHHWILWWYAVPDRTSLLSPLLCTKRVSGNDKWEDNIDCPAELSQTRSREGQFYSCVLVWINYSRLWTIMQRTCQPESFLCAWQLRERFMCAHCFAVHVRLKFCVEQLVISWGWLWFGFGKY